MIDRERERERERDEREREREREREIRVILPECTFFSLQRDFNNSGSTSTNVWGFILSNLSLKNEQTLHQGKTLIIELFKAVTHDRTNVNL